MTSDVERCVALEDALDQLRHDAEDAILLVEGRRDVEALESLGIGGRHMTSQRGRSMAQLVEEVVALDRRVILLMDWDRTGGRNARRLAELLHARVAVDLESRRRLASACHCKSLEDVPMELAALRRAASAPRGA